MPFDSSVQSLTRLSQHTESYRQRHKIGKMEGEIAFSLWEEV